jgi:hypothetical protein
MHFKTAVKTRAAKKIRAPRRRDAPPGVSPGPESPGGDKQRRVLSDAPASREALVSQKSFRKFIRRYFTSAYIPPARSKRPCSADIFDELEGNRQIQAVADRSSSV